MTSCVLSRYDTELQAFRRNGEARFLEQNPAELFLRQSLRRARRFLAGLSDNEDRTILRTADSLLLGNSKDGQSPS